MRTGDWRLYALMICFGWLFVDLWVYCWTVLFYSYGCGAGVVGWVGCCWFVELVACGGLLF